MNMATLRMKERVALVTGGGSGIGAATARLFAEEGAQVVVLGRHESPLRKIVDQLTSQGLLAGYYVGDVSDLANMEQVYIRIEETFGTVDALVHCAGIVNRLEDPVRIAAREQMKLIEVNLLGTMNANRLAIAAMLNSEKAGTIVNIASISAYRGTSGYATYSATKSAVISFTRVLALQYAEHGIRINSISPGIVDTPMGYVDRKDYDGERERLHRLHPLGRMGTPEDIAYSTLFLSCQESSWITGQDFIVDGGLTIE